MSSLTLNHLYDQAEAMSTAEQRELVERLVSHWKKPTAITEQKARAKILLEKSHGIWLQGDGLDYQQALRAEWDARS